jgi:hypothetical protein
MVRVSRGYVLAATAWLVLVVVGAVLVWAVISRAGQSVVGQQSPSVGQVAPFTAQPQPKQHHKPKTPKSTPKHPPTAPPGSPGGSAGPGSGQPSGSATSGPGPSAPPPSSPGPGPAPGPGPGPGPTSSPSSPPPQSSPPPSQPPAEQQGVRRTWQGNAGSVTVECRGAQIELLGAQPNTGWSVEVEDRGPDRVRVDFERTNGERRTRVEAVCVGGTPRFEIDH